MFLSIIFETHAQIEKPYFEQFQIIFFSDSLVSVDIFIGFYFVGIAWNVVFFNFSLDRIRVFLFDADKIETIGGEKFHSSVGQTKGSG